MINVRSIIADDTLKNFWRDGVSIEDYHADKTCVSNSTLKLATQYSPKKFHHRFFMAGEKSDTKPMKIGRLAHMALLEGAKFCERYVVMPEFVGLTLDGKVSAQSKQAKDKRAAWLDDQPPTALIVTEQERDKIVGMIDSILSHKMASDFLSAGIAETSGYFTDAKTGIRCRIRPDFMCEKRRFITEFKTTRDCRESEFKWDIYGERYDSKWYDFQLAMQGVGFQAITGKPLEVAAWVAVETEAPYEVAVHPMTLPVQELGEIKLRRALDVVKACIDSGSWPGVQKPDETSFIVPPDYMMDQYGMEYSGRIA